MGPVIRMRTCEVCGAPLAGQREHYCSDACRAKARANDEKSANAQLGKSRSRKPPKKQKKCVDCGIPFWGYARSLRCPECQAAAKKETDLRSKNRRARGEGRALGSTSFCEVCGKPYIVNGGLQTFCPECAQQKRRESATDRYHQNKEKISKQRSKSRRETYRKVAETRTRVCPACGKVFTPSQKQHVYCSPECSAQKGLSKQTLPATKAHASANTPKPLKSGFSSDAVRRVQLGLTQTQLAQKAGVSPSTVWKYEHGFPVSLHSHLSIQACLQSGPDSDA